MSASAVETADPDFAIECDWSGWTAQAFHVFGGDVGGTGMPVSGWTKGSLGLDFRPIHWDLYDTLPEEALPFAWVVTHLPSGWSIVALLVVASEARAMADEIAPLTDWGVITVGTHRFMEKRFRAWADGYRGKCLNASQTIAPCAMARRVDA